MSLLDPANVNAPRGDLLSETADFHGEMFIGAYLSGVLEGHGRRLSSQHSEDCRVGTVSRDESAALSIAQRAEFAEPTDVTSHTDE